MRERAVASERQSDRSSTLRERAVASERQSDRSSTLRNWLFVILFLSLVFLVACAPAQKSKEPVFCAADVKICPDGTAVVRVLPTCEFAKCPEISKNACTTDQDCICDGVDANTGDCFVGNKQYYEQFVDKEKQCPDFCTGIAGNLETRCVGNRCRVVQQQDLVKKQSPTQLVQNAVQSTGLPPECDEASDCVPAQCCHAADCVIKEKAPYCKDKFCSQECQPGTLDCGGSCACVNYRCTGTNLFKGAMAQQQELS